MRVLHWYPSFMHGGAVANAVRGLALAQSKQGAHVAIAASRSVGQPLYYPLTDFGAVKILEWIPRFTFRYKTILLRLLSKDIVKQCLAFNPDIVHIHGEFNPDNLRIPLLFKRPVILSPRGGFHPAVMGKGATNFKRIYFSLAKRICYRHVSAFHALSPMESGHISKLLKDCSVYCVPQGPNLWLMQNGSASPAVKKHNVLQLVFVGRLDVYTKGLDILIQTIAQVIKVLPNQEINLVLVGPDLNGGKKQLEDLSMQLNIRDRVTFTGTLTGDELRNVLESSDIYIQLSRHEALSSSALEALFMKLPTILSESVGLVSYPEVANLPHVKKVKADVKEVSGAVIDFAKRIVELKQMAAKSNSQLMEFFSWERTAKNHLDNYTFYL